MPRADVSGGWGGGQQTELAAAMADALEAGMAASAMTSTGQVAIQDVEAGKEAATGMSAQQAYAAGLEEGDSGMINQGTPASAVTAASAGTPTTAQGFTSPGYVNQVQTHEQMYPGHTKMAAGVGAAGLGFFTKARTDFVNNNKAQMAAMGIQPSHRNNAGELTGRYSSGDWKAFMSNLGGGTMATEEDDDSTTMEDSVERTVAAQQGAAVSQEEQAMGMAQPVGPGGVPLTEESVMGMPAPLGGGGAQGHPDWGLSGAAPNQGPYTGGPNVDNFSTWGQQVQPGVTSQVDMGTGYAPAPMTGPEQFTNYTAATTPMSGVQMTAPGQNTVGAPGASWGDYGAPTGGVTSNLKAAEDLIMSGQRLSPGFVEDASSEVDSFRNMPLQQTPYDPNEFAQASTLGARPTPSDYEQASLWRSGSFPVYGAQASGDSWNRMGGSLSSAPPGGQRPSGGTPVNQATVLGQQPAVGVGGIGGELGAGNIGIYGGGIYPQGTYGEMDEGTLDPNAGLIARGTEAFDADVDQAQVLARGLTPDVIERVSGSIQTIADKPIADGTDAPELIKNNVSSGGSNESRVEDLIKAGIPKKLIDVMEDGSVALIHLALTQLVAAYPNRKIAFKELIPYIQTLNLSEGTYAGAR